MKYARILSRVTGSPWCIRDNTLVALLDTLTIRINGAAMPMPEDPEDMGEQDQADDAPPGIAVVPLCGIIGKNLSMMEMLCGGCDLVVVEALLELSFESPGISAVILSVDSPGGIAAGVPELFEKIVAMRAASGKKLYSVIEQEGCSAGYYLAAAADRVFAAPTAMVGNIGMKMVIRDNSAANAAQGIKFHVFKSGEMKDIAASYRAPTKAEAELLQSQADELGARFRADVLSQRPGIDPANLEGQPFLGSQALAVGLVDELVSDIDELFEQLTPTVPVLTG